jgi:hypothetical protein
MPQKMFHLTSLCQVAANLPHYPVSAKRQLHAESCGEPSWVGRSGVSRAAVDHSPGPWHMLPLLLRMSPGLVFGLFHVPPPGRLP